MRPFWVSVPADAGSFQLGTAQVTASVVIQHDFEVATVQPTVLVELAETAQIQDGGAGVLLDVTVACPGGTSGRESGLVVSQAGRVMGSGRYTPICDGSRHTFTVRVAASEGLYEPGIAQALTFADVEYNGEVFSGFDDDGALDLVT